MNILHLFSISIIVSGSLYPVFALDTPQVCDASSQPHYHGIPSSHIYITDTNGSLPYNPLTYHTAIMHDDDVWNTSTQPRIVQVTLTMQNQDTGQQVFNQTQSLQMKACSGPEKVQWNFVPTQIAYYMATITDDKSKTSMDFYSIHNSTVDSQIILSPLKQFKSGIAPKDIKCAPDLQLVIKTKNHTPACIKPGDVSKLVERGWADKPNSLQEQLDMANACIGMTDACRHSYDIKNMIKENQTQSVMNVISIQMMPLLILEDLKFSCH
ncbi:MAG: hypothetical protein PXX83_02470 [Candidatus Nitrosotalea sp.]|nr:hypothetical protein [Candidatus Nitrosotalea sp.]